MARTSGETLSTSVGRPCSLARYISPSNSSPTGQKSFSNASRLENIAVLPAWEDALQFSSEGLTLPAGSVPGVLPGHSESDCALPLPSPEREDTPQFAAMKIERPKPVR